MLERDLEIQWLRSFQSVAHTGSMTKSAAALNRSQSAISMHIKNIEEALGKQIFHREIRKLTLTPVGLELQMHADKILQAHAAALQAITGHARTGHVSLGIPDDYATRHLPAILRAFTQKYPGIEVTLVCEPSSTLLPKIDAGELDVAIATPDHAGRGIRLASEPLVWIGILPDDTDFSRPLPVAMYEFGSQVRKKVTAALEKLPGGYRVVYSSPYIAGQIAAAESGMALAVLIKSIVPPHLNIVRHPALPALPVMDIAVVKSRTTSSGDIAQLLVDEITAAIR